MLQTLREKTSGWIATAILGLLMIPFLFVVDNSYLGGVGANNVAKVAAPPSWWASAPSWWPVSLLWRHHEISTEDFRARFEQLRMQAREQQGDAFDARAFESTENKRQALDQLIDEQVMRLASEQAGIVVGDNAVRDYIAAIPAFQSDGKFDPATYQMALAQGTPPRTPAQFQQLVRDTLQQTVIPEGLVESAFVTPGELERTLRLLGETRDVQFALLPEPAADTAPVTEAQVKQWYDGHPRDFMQPEQVTLQYVEVDGSKLPAPAEPDEAALRKRYDEEKARFVAPEQRLASHILITAGSDAAAQKAAEQKAAQIAEQARKPGADFAALAKADSQDPGSRDNGGDLGWVERGTMVKPFEDALFGAQDGAIVGPVKTEFGWHVIQVRGIKGGQGKSFEEVRAQLADEQRQADRDRAYSDLSGKLVDLVYKNPTALDQAATQAGLKVETIGPFSRQDAPGLAANPAVLHQAFSENLIADGTTSDPIELGPDHSVIIRVAAHTPAQAQPLAKVHDQVVAAIRADRQKQAGAQAAQALVERLRKGESLQAIAAAEKLQVTPMPGLPRTAPLPTAEANRAVFAAPAPADGKPAVGHIAMPDGRQALFVVDKVTPGDVAAVPAEQKTALRQQLEQLDGVDAAKAFIQALRKRDKITLNESQL